MAASMDGYVTCELSRPATRAGQPVNCPHPKILKNKFTCNKLQSFAPPTKISAGCGPGALRRIQKLVSHTFVCLHLMRVAYVGQGQSYIFVGM